jgi:hypothetical protein
VATTGPDAEDPNPAAADPPAGDPKPAPAGRTSRRRRPANDSADALSDRGLRDLVGAGPSQLRPAKAMRARDVNRPTDEDLAEAQRTVSLVRRNWTPS